MANTWGVKNIGRGDTILLTEMEHHSNIVPWQLLAERTGATLAYVPVTGDDGLLRLEGLDDLLGPKVKLLAFTFVSNTLGTVNPAAELCARARRRGVATLVDAAQAVGHRRWMFRNWAVISWCFRGTRFARRRGLGRSTGGAKFWRRCRLSTGAGT